MKHPASIIPVIGTTKKERILASIKSININLDSLDWFSLLEASKGKRVA
jgi:predicted oxidoreductase